MKKSIIYILFIAVLACNSSDDNRTDIIKQMVDEVSYLSSDELEGRETGTDGEKKAAEVLGQSLSDFRREFWFDMRDRLITEKYQQQMINNIKITRSDVISFYNVYKDSLPPIPTKVKTRHLLIPILPSEKAKNESFLFLKNIKLINSLAIFSLLITVILILNQPFQSAFLNSFVVDEFSLVLKVMILIGSIASLIMFVSSKDDLNINIYEYNSNWSRTFRIRIRFIN